MGMYHHQFLMCTCTGNLINPWYSGLAQGQGISVLCRAYKTTGNDKYLDSIKKAYRSFLIDVNSLFECTTEASLIIYIFPSSSIES